MFGRFMNRRITVMGGSHRFARGRHRSPAARGRGAIGDAAGSAGVSGPGADMDHRRQCRLDGDPEAVRTARALVRNALRAWDLADLADDAILVVSELVTNATVHGAPPVTFTVTYGVDLVIEVADACRDLPARRLPGSGGHFGLLLAGELSEITVRPSSGGKAVVATFRHS